MIDPTTRQVHVHADLSIEIDGQDVSVRADGQDINVFAPSASEFGDQLTVVASALGGSLRQRRRSLGAFAEALDKAGLRVNVIGRSGPLIVIGRSVSTPVLKWLVGSSHVRAHLGRELLLAVASVARRRLAHVRRRRSS